MALAYLLAGTRVNGSGQKSVYNMDMARHISPEPFRKPMRISCERILPLAGVLCALLLLLSACGTTGTTGTAPPGSETTRSRKPPEKPPAKTASEAEQAQEHLRAGEYKKAREAATEAIAHSDKGADKVIAALDKEADKERRQGARAFKSGDLIKSISHWERSLEMNPGARGLKEDLENTKLLHLAQEAIAKKDYAAAHHALNKATRYGLTKESALELIGKLRALADERNRAGMRHYVAERIDRAIEEWETALRIYPGHARALNNLDDARKLKKKIQEVR